MASKLTLQGRIEQRKKQAENRGLYWKSAEIARHLGSKHSLDDDHGTSGNQYNFEDKNFKIEYRQGEISGSDGSMGFCGLEVSFKDNLVFRTGSADVDSYIPGKWEKDLTALHVKALKAKATAERKQAEQAQREAKSRETELKIRWGL